MNTQSNDMQKEAIEHVEGPLLVLAGAGSGKTRIVTHRIAYLLSIGVPSSEILAVTFTNKAADEMKHRIKKLSNQNVLTCTFHSLGARILRESIHEIGFNNNFSIYDDEDTNKLIKDCFKTLDIQVDRSMLKSIKNSISDAKNSLITPSSMKQPSFSSQEFSLLKEVYTLYEQKLKQSNALDFDDLLFKTVTLLRESETARNHYQDRWRFILVDEYQDTNTSQYVLTRLLAHKHQNLFVVGDPDQSIYSWRGANIGNILNFEEDFENTKVVKLEQNYRSTSHILSAANSLIKNNSSRYEKKLWSSLGEGEKVHIEVLENEQEEALYITNQILTYLKKGFSLKDMVIFYRTNAQSRIFEDYLLRENLPYVIVGGISFYQRREVKDVIAYLKLLVFESDFISFSRVINLPKRGLGPAFIQKLQQLSEKHLIPIVSLCKELINSSQKYPLKLSQNQRVGLTEFLSIIDRAKALLEEEAPLKEIIKTIIQDSKYLDYLKNDKETFDERKENLDELISKASSWEQENATNSLLHFLEELSLKSSSDEQQHHNDTIKLMTLHNGKGLEFDVCFIVGMEEDLLPHINSKEDSASLEEERRLCYVGMTRAKKHLYLTASKYRLFWGSPKNMNLSRFIKELDQNYIEFSQEELLEDEFLVFSPGTKVLHKDFGKGVIKKSYQTSLGDTYDVYFQDLHATRSLVAKFAKLQIL